MDETLYYVESPDGQVLGPMNLMHILEGIAAGAILESARICEVGAQEWVPLSDVMETREVVPNSAEAGPGAAASAGAAIEAAAPAEPEEEPLALTEAWTQPEKDAPEGNGLADTDTFAAPEAEPAAETLEAEPAAETFEPEPATAAEPETFEVETFESEPEPEFEAEPEFESEPEPAESSLAESSLAEPDIDVATPESLGESELLGVPDETPFEEGPVEKEVAAVAAVTGGGNEGGGRGKWMLIAAALAVPVLVGVWLLVGKSSAPGGRDAQAPAVATTPLQEARELLVAGQAGEAVLRYEKILEEEPDNAVAHHGLGLAALAVGDPELAVDHLETAVAGNASRPVWNADLADALQAAGRIDSALQKLNAYLVDVPEDRERQKLRLDWMLAADKEKIAAKTYGALADETPVNGYHQYLAGLAHGEGKQAETYLRRAVELDPEQGDAHAALARVLAVAGKADAAAESMRRATELRPATPEDAALMASLQNAGASAKPTQAVASTRPNTVAPPKQAEPTVTASAPKPKAPEPAAPKAKAPVPAPKQVASAPKPAPAKPKVEAPPAPAPEPSVPAAASGSSELVRMSADVRKALASEQFDRAKEILAGARAKVSGADAERNLELWDGIIAFEEGRFDAALSTFEQLDPNASYRASGWGTGTVPNWIARVHFAKGDVRRAVAALDGVGPADPDEYATARLWEGVALASLGMEDLAARTWKRIPGDVGTRVGTSGQAAVKTAEMLSGAISEKDYTTALQPMSGFENDMHFFLAYAAHRKQDAQTTKQHLAKAMESSAGHEFPYHVASAAVSGDGILK